MPLFGPPDIAKLEAKRDAQGLIKALSFNDAAIRMAAAEALAPIKDPASVEPLVGLLKDENVGVRRAAVAALAARGGIHVVEPLVSMLEDPDPDVRATAATAVYRRLMTDPDQDTRRGAAAAIGRIRPPDAAETLVKAMMDSDEGVRVAAIKALQSIGDVAAIVPLIIVLSHEQLRQKSTGRSSPAVERATSVALDALCDEKAVAALQHALEHDEADVREIAVKRLARVRSPLIADALASSLRDEDPGIRRAAARGLAEIGWQPPADETGAAYWAALREWRRAAEAGPAAIPLLVSSFDHVDALEQADIIGALVQLNWQPTESTTIAARYWAAQGRWDKCREIGEPAVDALDGVLRNAPKWRDRVAAAETLVALNEPRVTPFARLDLVQRALAIIDGAGTADDKRGLFEALLADERQFDPDGETIEWCKCGYPAARVGSGGVRELLGDMLGFERSASGANAHFCPSCDARHSVG